MRIRLLPSFVILAFVGFAMIGARAQDGTAAPASDTSGLVRRSQTTTNNKGQSSPSSRPAPARIRIGASVEQASLIHQVTPMYPPDAKAAHVSGTVVLHAIIRKDGTVNILDVVSGPPMLVQSAEDAVKQWQYKPLLLNGQAVEVETEINVVYTLNGSYSPSTTPPAQQTAPSPTQPTVPPPVDQSKEPYIYESVRGTMRFEKSGTGSVETSARILVQSFAGVQRMGQLIFEYASDNEKLDIRSVKVTKPDGQVIVASADAVQDLAAPVAQMAPMYTDARQKHVTVPGLSPGDLLEYDVVKTIVQPLTPGQFWDEWDFVNEGICDDEEVDLDVPASAFLNMKSPAGVDPTVAEKDGRRVYHWHASNATAVGAVQGALPTAASGFSPTQLLQGAQQEATPRRMMFSTFQTWDSVAKWYYSLERDRRLAGPDVRAKADELVQGAQTQEDKARAIYLFVSRNIRYVSLSFGLGRFQPHAAAEVLKNEYGDCKDKATLLGAMLGAEGIESSTVLINSEANIDRAVPTPLQFDHAITIATVDGHDVWLDSTLGVGPYAYLLPQLRGKIALVVGPDGLGKITRAPADLVNPQLYKFSIEGNVTKSSGDMHFTADIQGDDTEVLLRAALLQVPASALAAAINQQMKTNATAGSSSLADLQTSDPTDTRTPLHIEAQITGTPSAKDSSTSGDQASDPAGNLISALLDAGVLSYVLPAVPTTAYVAQVTVGGPKEMSLQIKISDSADKQRSFSVPAVDIQKDFAEYHAQAGWDGDTLTADFDLHLLQKQVAGDRLAEYADFRKAVIESFGPAGKKAALDELDQSGLSAYQARNYKESASLLESLVADDPKYKGAWNDLGRAYLEMRQYDKAADAFGKAIDNDPKEPNAYNNLGLVFLRQGKYDLAIPQFKKQIAKDQWAHSNFGNAYVQTKQYADAANELEIAATITPKDINVQLNLGAAYANLGKTDDAKKAFDEALILDSSTSNLESVAWTMATNKFQLAEAEKDAQSAIDLTEGKLQTTSIDSIQQGDLLIVPSLSGCWSTMAWVKFEEGDFASAEKFQLAAIMYPTAIGAYDRLGQIYEKEGRKADAIREYETELRRSSISAGTRGRLAALLGGDDKVDQAVASVTPDLPPKVSNPNHINGHAQFWILYSPGNATPEVRFATGDDSMRSLAPQLRTGLPPLALPGASHKKVLRSFWFFCKDTDSECTSGLAGVEMSAPNSVNSVPK